MEEKPLKYFSQFSDEVDERLEGTDDRLKGWGEGGLKRACFLLFQYYKSNYCLEWGRADKEHHDPPTPLAGYCLVRVKRNNVIM